MRMQVLTEKTIPEIIRETVPDKFDRPGFELMLWERLMATREGEHLVVDIETLKRLYFRQRGWILKELSDFCQIEMLNDDGVREFKQIKI